MGGSRRGLVAVVLAVACAAVGLVTGPSSSAGAAPVQILTLSNRADLISGGNALVEIRLPAGASASAPRIDLNGRNISAAFAARKALSGRIVGVVEGLRNGRNVVTARHPAGSARLVITNHPKGGPIFAGPQVRPWICATEENGLGPPRDAQCNATTTYTWHYRSAATGQLLPYNPESPPPHDTIATTTTDDERTVPFIVRRERGTMNRGIYDVAVLYDPDEPWRSWSPQRGWNHKVLWLFGTGCTANHEQGPPPNVLTTTAPGQGEVDLALSRGFAVAANSMFDNTRNCNDVVQAESVMMLREHITETYGQIRYTIGSGASGGSMSQLSTAANYPGLIDGIQPAATFPDIWTTYTEFGDCHLLMRYFNEVSPHLWANAQQRAWASGHGSVGPCAYGTARAPAYMAPDVGDGCADYDWAYDPEQNPKGVRCSVPDYQVALWGRRAKDGFANRAWDNVGVQYGLAALERGHILPEQFVDLNEKVGGWDIDLRWQPDRTIADRAGIEVAYRAGRLHNGRQLAKVPIIDLRGSSNHEGHYDFHTRIVRERLRRDNGHFRNHVYWNGPGPLLSDPQSTREAFLLIDRWLAAIERDRSRDPLAAKVLRNKPFDAVDACWFGTQKVTDQSVCDTLISDHRDARVVAGAPFTADVVKCRLQPLRRDAYPVEFSDDQWERLRVAFPDGVCDYSRPGIGQRAPDGPWMTFADGPGGRPLGPAPRSRPVT